MSESRAAGKTLELIRNATLHAVTVHGRLSLRDEVRRILDGGNEWQEEAADKHLDRLRQVREEAWNEGFDRGFYDPLAGSSKDASESVAANPYERTAK